MCKKEQKSSFPFFLHTPSLIVENLHRKYNKKQPHVKVYEMKR